MCDVPYHMNGAHGPAAAPGTSDTGDVARGVMRTQTKTSLA